MTPRPSTVSARSCARFPSAEWLLPGRTTICQAPAAVSHLPATSACRLLQGLQEWKRSASAALVFQVLHGVDEMLLQPFRPDAERLPREHVQLNCTAAERFRSDAPSSLRRCLHCTKRVPALPCSPAHSCDQV